MEGDGEKVRSLGEDNLVERGQPTTHDGKIAVEELIGAISKYDQALAFLPQPVLVADRQPT